MNSPALTMKLLCFTPAKSGSLPLARAFILCWRRLLAFLVCCIERKRHLRSIRLICKLRVGQRPEILITFWTQITCEAMSTTCARSVAPTAFLTHTARCVRGCARRFLSKVSPAAFVSQSSRCELRQRSFDVPQRRSSHHMPLDIECSTPC
eukprot:6197892-Pleurochrysis_carterae.AAC.2